MKEYLGDGVYVEVYHGMVRLTTEDGEDPERRGRALTTNTIYLDPEVMERFLEWYKNLLRADVRKKLALRREDD